MPSLSLPRLLCVLAAAMLFSAPAAAQNISGYNSDLREVDPDRNLVLQARQVEGGSTLAYVYVTDAWYNLRCFQRQRLAKSLKALWKKQGGNNIVVYDRAGTEVADFKIFGSDFDIRGCD